MDIGWLRDQARELAVDRGRAILVLLGVLWGTLSLTVVLSFGEGLGEAVEGVLLSQGRDIIVLWEGATTRPHAGFPAGRAVRFETEDAARIARGVPGVRAASVEFIRGAQPVRCGSVRANAPIHGVDASYGELRRFFPQPGGRFLDERDEAEGRRVAFLGGAVKEMLFGAAPAVGREIEIWGTPFAVIGALPPRPDVGGYEGFDRDKVMIPASTFRALTGWSQPDCLVVGAESPARGPEILRGIYRVLGADRGFDPGDSDALFIFDKIAMDREWRGVLGGIRILMGIVGALGLLVALVGVANVMFVLVEERRREIGIEMALGARPAGLLGRFLAGGILLTFAGGIAGALLAAAALWLFNRLPLGEDARNFLGRPGVSVPVAILVTGVLSLAGCLAGWFPARRAAVLDPVEALREE